MIIECNVFVINAKVVKHSGPKIVGAKWPILGVFTLLVGGAYNLAHFQSTTRNKHRHRLWPMVATWLFHSCLSANGITDPRGAAKFPGHNQENFFIKAPVVKIIDQRSDGLVKYGRSLRANPSYKAHPWAIACLAYSGFPAPWLQN